MDKKTLSIVLVITTLLCGLPGLCGLCFGSMAILGSFLPNTEVAPSDAGLVVGISVMIVGLSLVFIAIPVGLAVWNWWSHRPPKLREEDILIPEDDF